MVVRVGQSQIGPHRTSRNGQHRFPVRNSGYTADMSYDQLRMAFDRTASLAERARSFRKERLDAIAAVNYGVRQQTSVVVHVLPLAGMGTGSRIDIRDAYANPAVLEGPRWMGTTRSYNLDGLLVSEPSHGQSSSAYTQLYRSGAIETVRGGLSTDFQGVDSIGAAPLTTFTRSMIRMALAATARFGSIGGALVGVTVFDVHGRQLGVGQYFNLTQNTRSDRPILVLPEAWVEDIANMDLDAVCRPILDVLWQCFGIEGCLFYEQDGTFNPQKLFN